MPPVLVKQCIMSISLISVFSYVLLGVGLPIVIFIVAIAIINKLQSSRPQSLPEKLHDWDFLPKGLHSLEPYDRIFIWVSSYSDYIVLYSNYTPERFFTKSKDSLAKVIIMKVSYYERIGPMDDCA